MDIQIVTVFYLCDQLNEALNHRQNGIPMKRLEGIRHLNAGISMA